MTQINDTQLIPTQELITNIVGWAGDRGILRHGTYKAQLLKALSEVGELADAYVKKDSAGVRDAIGDIAVCTICAAHLMGEEHGSISAATIAAMEADVSPERKRALAPHLTALEDDSLIVRLASLVTSESLFNEPMSAEALIALIAISATLQELAERQGANLNLCLNLAWNEIKDRKGYMSEGGVFVKENA